MKLKYTIIGMVCLGILLSGTFLFFNNNKSSPMTGSFILETSELAGDPDKLTVYFFWGEGCPHCETQKPFLQEMTEKYPEEIEVKSFETWKTRDNVQLFMHVAEAYGIQARGVPTTFIGDKHWIGFSASMGNEMESYIQNCIENGCESPLI